MSKRTDVPQVALRRALRFLWLEGAFFSAYDVWLGPVYLSGLAGELGVSIGLVSLLTSVQWIGQAGQLLGLWALERTESYKRYMLITAVAARALWTLPMFLAVYWTSSGHGFVAFPVTAWLLLTAVAACCSSVLACTSGVAWGSWTAGLIPPRFQGRFFGVKQRFTMAAVIAANFAAAFLVGWQPGGQRVGYAVQGTLALVCAFLSVLFLALVPQGNLPPLGAGLPAAIPRPLREILREPLRDRKFLRFLLFVAAFNAAILLSGPYYPYFFTKELGIPMSTIAVWLLLNNLGSFLAAGFWGQRVDGRARAGARDRSGAETAAWIGGWVICFSPIFYAVPSTSFVRAIGPIEYFCNGAGFVAYNIAIIALLYRHCPRGKNAAYFSVYSAALGICGAASVFLGGQLARVLEPVGGFRALWIVSAAARLAVLWFLGRPLLRRRRAALENSATG